MRGWVHGASGLLLSAEHLQNLLRGLGTSVGLVRVGLLLLAGDISAVDFGLSRLSGLGLIVRVFVGVILLLVFGAIVGVGVRRLYRPGLRDDERLVEGLRLGKAVGRHCP